MQSTASSNSFDSCAEGEDVCAPVFIFPASASVPSARPKLFETRASILRACAGIAADGINLLMALFSSRGIAPRAYGLKASNATPPISTMTGTSLCEHNRISASGSEFQAANVRRGSTAQHISLPQFPLQPCSPPPLGSRRKRIVKSFQLR